MHQRRSSTFKEKLQETHGHVIDLTSASTSTAIHSSATGVHQPLFDFQSSLTRIEEQLTDIIGMLTELTSHKNA